MWSRWIPLASRHTRARSADHAMLIAPSEGWVLEPRARRRRSSV